MTLAGVKEGDIVHVDIRGDRFYGFVKRDLSTINIGPREIAVLPISNGRSPVRLVTARQVIGHWRKRKARAA